jgi:GWxTD domain-containing protein
VNCYLREFPVARPPYLEDREPVFDYRPDSSFTINFSGGSSEVFIVREMGFYHFLRDTSRRAGYTLFCFSDGYPDVTTPEQLAGPLRYITTRKEYDSVMSSGNLKAGVDNFWLSTARSPERALALLQKFYSQVEESNTWFSSYTEGWKTDRGLIFTVLGRPDYVFRDNDSEEWVYGEPGYRNSLRFTFVFVSNPFTDNDFMLLRSPTFKDPWFITVQSWRR